MSKEAALAAFAQIPSSPVESIPPAVQAEPVVENKTQDLQSSRIAQLLKKEAEVQRLREEVKKEKELTLKEKEALLANQAKIKEYDEFQELKNKDKIAAMRRAGFTQEDIMNALASFENELTPEQRAEKAAQAKIDEWQAQQTKKEKEILEKRNAEIFENYKGFIKDTIMKEADKFELCSLRPDDAKEIAFSMIEEHHKESGQPMDLKEALELVEEYFENEYRPIVSAKKFLPKADPVKKEDLKELVKEQIKEAKEEPLKPEVNPRPKTLSNKTTATSASTTMLKKETMSEKKARLAAKLASFGKE
jgi:hypothetical protein